MGNYRVQDKTPHRYNTDGLVDNEGRVMTVIWIIGWFFTDGLYNSELPWHDFITWPYYLGKYLNKKMEDK